MTERRQRRADLMRETGDRTRFDEGLARIRACVERADAGFSHTTTPRDDAYVVPAVLQSDFAVLLAVEDTVHAGEIDLLDGPTSEGRARALPCRLLVREEQD